jgi:hypothetical protein
MQATAITGRMWSYDNTGQRYTSLEQYETAPLHGGTRGNSLMLPGSWVLKDTNGDGVINANDQLPNILWANGVNPPLQYAFSLSGAFKGFDASVLLQGSSLYSVYVRNNDIWGYGRYPSLHTKFMDRWHTENVADDPFDPNTNWTEGRFPALRSNFTGTMDGQVFDQWVIPATYLRLKTVEIGYSLPASFVQRYRMDMVRIFINGHNLHHWSDKNLKEADPERHETDWDAGLTYPIMMSFNFGLNVNF